MQGSATSNLTNVSIVKNEAVRDGESLLLCTVKQLPSKWRSCHLRATGISDSERRSTPLPMMRDLSEPYWRLNLQRLAAKFAECHFLERIALFSPDLAETPLLIGQFISQVGQSSVPKVGPICMPISSFLLVNSV